ncbi:MAG: helix-turn-helix domain-containing protein [Oscillospiraceae bacterium]|nr:helix-turn-helix domain-containing protein [Oscillospiraceae bacterium]
MKDSELKRLEILYDVRKKEMSVTEIAKKHNVHRNTVRNVKNAYAGIKDEDVIKYYKNPSSSNNIFVKKRTPKVVEIDLEIIERLCKEHLNCYLTLEQICKKLCENKKVKFEEVQNYNRQTLEYMGYWEYEKGAKKRLRSKIFSIRSKKHPSKNYKEVYEKYFVPMGYQIPYKRFYLYAKDFWIDVEWKNPERDLTLGELIDDKETAKKRANAVTNDIHP